MAEKMSVRKEARQPDALQRAGSDAREWLAQRQKAVGIAVVVVLLVGLAAAVASYVSQRSEERAARDLGGVLSVLERPVQEGATPPPAEGSDPQSRPFSSQKDKDEAAVKAFTDFRNANKGTEAATTAALPLAQAQLRLRDFDAAATSFADFLKNAKQDDPLRASALEGQGYAYEGKGDLDKALASFDQLAKDNKTDFLSGMGMFHRARVLILQGKKDEAAQVLTDLQTAHPDTAASKLAKERLSLLASQGVKIPTPAPAAASDAGVQG